MVATISQTHTIFHLGVIMWMKCGWFQVEAVPIVEAAAAVSD